MTSASAAPSIPTDQRREREEDDAHAPSSSHPHPQELLLSAPGPYGHARFEGSVQIDSNIKLATRLTVPVPVDAGPPDGAAAFSRGSGLNTTTATARPTTNTKGGQGATTWPVVLHFSGFQCVSAQYAPLAERLASHGYAVVQYDLPRLWPGVSRLVPDEQELSALRGVWAWALGVGGLARPSTLLLDEGRLSVAGHSRGGKVAALHYARQWLVPAAGGPPAASAAAAAAAAASAASASRRRRRCPLGFGGGGRAGGSGDQAEQPPPPALPPLHALFLADPVDNTPALARRGFPSGVDALRSAIAAAAAAAAAGSRAKSGGGSPSPTFALACAGRFGGGNPMGCNWLEFLAVAPPGARSLLVHNAGHATFIQFPPDGSAGARAIDWAFGGGSAPREQTMALTAGFLLAWLRRRGLAAAGGGGSAPDPDEEAAADAEEARWLAAVQGVVAGAGSAATTAPPPVVRISAEEKLGGAAAPLSAEEEESEGLVAAQVVPRR